MNKDKEYSISEASEITGYDKHVLRYYEDDFNLEIPRTKSNRRYYTYKEIETFLYIKELQEKGLTNKQIKLIFECPEIFIRDAQNELVISSSNNPLYKYDNTISEIQEICCDITNTISEDVKSKLEETKNEIISYFENKIYDKGCTVGDMEETKLKNDEKDILLCENARLKMKVKEKSYEVVQLKEKLNKLDEKKIPFWKRIFLSPQE